MDYIFFDILIDAAGSFHVVQFFWYSPEVSMGTIHVNFAYLQADARSKVLAGRGLVF